MIKWKILATLLLIANLVLARNPVTLVIVRNNTNQDIYLGWHNYLDVVVEKTSCSQLLITTDNGRLEQKDCQLTLIPDTVGYATITVKKKGKDGSEIVDYFSFIVKDDFDLAANVGGKASGKIKAADLLPQLGISILARNFPGGCYCFGVVSYTCIIRHKDGGVFIEDCKGPAFTQTIKNEILSMSSGCQVFFVNVKAQGCYDERKKVFDVVPVEFKLTD